MDADRPGLLWRPGSRYIGLVGRREQLATIEEAVRQVEAGDPQLVVIAGEAGVGKTYLMGHVADRLEETGARVLRTTCVELGTHGLPLVPMTSALRQIVGLLGVDILRRTVPGADPRAAGASSGSARSRTSASAAPPPCRCGWRWPRARSSREARRASR